MSDGDHVLQRVTWDELVSVRRFEAYSEELTASYPRHYPYKHGSTRQQQQQQQPSFHTSPTFDLWHVVNPAPEPSPTQPHLPLHPTPNLHHPTYTTNVPRIQDPILPTPSPPPPPHLWHVMVMVSSSPHLVSSAIIKYEIYLNNATFS